MQYSQATMGRVFVVRLEDGDVVHEAIEDLARRESIRAAALIVVGGADQGSRLVVGPLEPRSTPVTPMEFVLRNVHEVAGTGTLFPDETGRPVIHMHMACGREEGTVTGCIRRGVKVWHIMEVVLFELVDSTGERFFDTETGFNMLKAGKLGG